MCPLKSDGFIRVTASLPAIPTTVSSSDAAGTPPSPLLHVYVQDIAKVDNKQFETLEFRPRVTRMAPSEPHAVAPAFLLPK